MIKKFYSIFDTTAGHFLNPLEAKNHADAIRLFTTFVNGDKDQSNIARYPTQFVLFHMFDFDDKTGITGTYSNEKSTMEKQEPPKELIIGAACVEEQNKKFTINELRQLLNEEPQNVTPISEAIQQ